MNTKQNYAFISYARKDEFLKNQFVDMMIENCINYKIDQDILRAGSDWNECIHKQAIPECTVFIMLISNNFIKSKECEREYNKAISENKDIVMFSLIPDDELHKLLRIINGDSKSNFYDYLLSKQIVHQNKCLETLKTHIVLKSCVNELGVEKLKDIHHFHNIEYWKQKLSLNPKDSELNLRLGEIYYEKEDYNNALYYFNRTNHIEGIYYSGLINEMLNDSEEAIKHYEKVKSKSSIGSEFYSKACMKLAEYNEQKANINKAIKIYIGNIVNNDANDLYRAKASYRASKLYYELQDGKNADYYAECAISFSKSIAKYLPIEQHDVLQEILAGSYFIRGNLYFSGIGVEKDRTRAYRLYEEGYTYQNASNSDGVINRYSREKNWLKVENKDGAIKLPVICECLFDDQQIEINDSQTMYELPLCIQIYFVDIFEKYNMANIYNQLNVRVESWYKKENKFVMNTGRTNYYNSLVTNRAMDYKFKNQKGEESSIDKKLNLTVRDLLQYGPFYPKLEQSKLSNHIGFNLFIISEDKKVLFIKRGGKVSVAQNIWGTSVSASVKTKYCLNDDGEFTVNGFSNSVISEISDELKVKIDDISFDINNNAIAAYRDVMEGGKPQFIFYADIKKTSKDIEDNFKKELELEFANGNYALDIDGVVFKWFDMDEINDFEVYSDCFYHTDRNTGFVNRYEIHSSTSGTIELFRRSSKVNL